MLTDLVRQNRSCRRFYQEHRVPADTLWELVDLARLSASGANLQPLKYIASCHPEQNETIFRTLSWAGYLKTGPDLMKEKNRPPTLSSWPIRPSVRTLVATTVLQPSPFCWAPREKGLAGCLSGTIKRQQLKERLGIAPQYKIQLVVALGKPREEVVVDPLRADGGVKYWRDADGIHHVPNDC